MSGGSQYKVDGLSHYQRNRADYVARVAIRNKEWRAHVREKINAAKNRPCCDCGKSYPSYVMDLDHVNPAMKSITPSHMGARGWSDKRIDEEIAKCEVVCSNCHRERTHGG